MDGENDALLLERFRQGDQSTFEALFTRHYQQVYRAAYGLVRSHDAAEDLAQEAFLALYRQPPPPAAHLALVGWLCRVALNRGINLLRGERREQARLASFNLEASVDPTEAILRDEQRTQVRAALRRLPERQAQLLALRYAGLSYAEIAAALELAPGSIGTLLVRAERAFLAAYTALDPELNRAT
jgi:RNA polymerase sigma-70 factor (ECF subfamily)